jgi:hypothetical protein
MLALKSFRTAAVTLAGVELAHRIRKRQFSFGRGGPRRFCSLQHLWARALVCHDAATERRNVTVVALNRQLHQNSRGGGTAKGFATSRSLTLAKSKDPLFSRESYL